MGEGCGVMDGGILRECGKEVYERKIKFKFKKCLDQLQIDTHLRDGSLQTRSVIRGGAAMIRHRLDVLVIITEVQA
jgi:hypothetical protein